MSELSDNKPRVHCLYFFWSFSMNLMIAVSRFKVAEDTHLNLPVLEDASSFHIQFSVFVTQGVQLLDSQLSSILIEDYDIMVVWIEANPVIVVRPNESSACVHDLGNDCGLTCVSRSANPSVFAFDRRIKWIVVGPSWDLLQLLFFL